MVRNLMAACWPVGQGQPAAAWMAEVLAARDARLPRPTFAPDGLYFLGPRYDQDLQIPERTAAFDWLPG